MENSERPAKRRKRPRITLYDAIAGRVGHQGFLSPPRPSKERDTISDPATAIPPDEALWRRGDAPQRFQEDDIYFADRHLEPGQRLPDSDLLMALHRYVADFYEKAVKVGIGDDEEESWRSLDETALLALGMLIEEAAAEVMGETGDLALVRSEEGKG
jgi:hypothetical protein